MTQPNPNMISYCDLPPAQPGEPLAVEWELYRREVGRLLAEGHAGRHILIKDDNIIGIYDTDEEAVTEGSRRFFGQDILVCQILAEERVYRAPWANTC